MTTTLRVVVLAWLFAGGIITRTALYGQSTLLPPRPSQPISFRDTVNILPPVIAFTKCLNNRAHTWIDVELLTTDSARAILVHESVHRVQATRFPTCHEWEESREKHPEQAAMEEVEAFCASLVVEPEESRHRKREAYVVRLMRSSNGSSGTVGPVVIRQMFDDFCPDVSDTEELSLPMKGSAP